MFISQQAVAKWESNIASPNPEMIAKISRYFGVSADYLLDREPTEKKVEISDDDVKVALFGGDGEVTDDMWDEVRGYVNFVKERQKKKDANK